MTFEEWAKIYPARTVDACPKHYRSAEATYDEAVRVSDYVEQTK